jgi:hypothetical protein
MATYNNKRLTEMALRVYAETLQTRLPRVKFMLDKGDAVKAAVEKKVFRLIGQYAKMVVQFSLDDHMRRDGSIDEHQLAEAVAGAFSEPVITAVEVELQPEEDDHIKRIGAEELWVLHDMIPVSETNGKGQAEFVEADQIGMMGQTWYDTGELRNTFTARVTWGLLRSGEIKKVAINRFDPPRD